MARRGSIDRIAQLNGLRGRPRERRRRRGGADADDADAADDDDADNDDDEEDEEVGREMTARRVQECGSFTTQSNGRCRHDEPEPEPDYAAAREHFEAAVRGSGAPAAAHALGFMAQVWRRRGSTRRLTSRSPEMAWRARS